MTSPTPKTMRIARYLSMCGIASRRKSEELIRSGKVTLNGEPLTDPATNIDPESDAVTFEGKPVVAGTADVTLIYYKPKRVIVSREDPQERLTVYQELPGKYLYQGLAERLRYGGRLDYMSEGLLIMSTDGKLIHQLTHPTTSSTKRYAVHLHRKMSQSDMEACLEGVTDDDELLKCTAINNYRDLDQGRVPLPGWDNIDRQQIVIVDLAEGRNRHIRRMMAGIGFETRRLARIGIGAITAKGMEPGDWKEATSEDYSAFFEDPAYAI